MTWHEWFGWLTKTSEVGVVLVMAIVIPIAIVAWLINWYGKHI